MKPIENHPSWFKTGHTVMNTDDRARQEYLKRQAIARRTVTSQETTTEQINNLGERVSKIEDALSRILMILENKAT